MSPVRPLITALFGLLIVFLSACSERPAFTPDVPGAIPAPGPGPPPTAAKDEYEADEVVMHLAIGASIDSVNARYGTTTLEAIESAGFYRLGLPDGMTVEEMVQISYEDLDVISCQPNYRLQDPEARQSSLAFDDGIDDVNILRDQNALGQVRAWIGHLAGGGSGVLVAVIDTGMDMDHPFLASRLGVGAYDFVQGDEYPDEAPNCIDDDGDGRIDEALGHGTHAAGLIAAVAPQCRLLPVRVLNDDGVGTAYNLARAIRYAADRGATVINLSLGMLEQADIVQDAEAYARGLGAICAASVGNDGLQGVIHFPASESSCISVLAVDAFDVKAPFSNYDSSVSVAAPGVGVYSTYWDGGSATWSGTSMATAIVSGALAVLRGRFPDLAPDDVREAVRHRGVDISVQNPTIAEDMGRGRLDLGRLIGVDPGGAPPFEPNRDPVDWK
jgi:subtilisin family serine protease